MKTRAFVLIVESNVSGDFDFQVVPLSRFDSDVFFSWHLPPSNSKSKPKHKPNSLRSLNKIQILS